MQNHVRMLTFFCCPLEGWGSKKALQRERGDKTHIDGS
jgi:hypothetical protein